jgi:DnaJ-class molecular chaperone
MLARRNNALNIYPTSYTMTMSDDIECEMCRGSGRIVWTDPQTKMYMEIECEFCEGKGMVRNPESTFWRKKNK